MCTYRVCVQAAHAVFGDNRGSASDIGIVMMVGLLGLGGMWKLGAGFDASLSDRANSEPSLVGAQVQAGSAEPMPQIDVTGGSFGGREANGPDTSPGAGGNGSGAGGTGSPLLDVLSDLGLADPPQNLHGSALANRRADQVVQEPGRLSHQVDPAFFRLGQAKRAAVLDQLDRDAWSDNPSGSKPVAAWTRGDAVGALLDDYFVPPATRLVDAIEDVLGGIFGESIELGDEASQGVGPGTSDFLNAGTIRQLEYEASQNTPKALRARIAEHQDAEALLGDRLRALRAFEEAGIGEYGELKAELRNQLSATEDLEVLLQLKLGMAKWEAHRDGATLDSEASADEMGPLDAGGALAQVRDFYLDGSGDPQRAEELLLLIAGSGEHSAGVQQALLERESVVDDQIEALESEVVDGVAMASLAPDLEAHVKQLNRSRRDIRGKRQELLEEHEALIDTHNAQHARGDREGLKEGAWEHYQDRAEKIRELTAQINRLGARDANITDQVREFNALVRDARIRRYRGPQPPEKLADVSNPVFFSTRPEPGFTFPVKGSHAISSYFGEMASYRSGAHTGVDFPVASGTPLHAVQSGKVVWAGSTGAFGNSITLRHPDGSATSYSHLTSFSVSPGQTVSRDQVIGLSGSTGNITGPHLHFEYYPPGYVSNDYSYGNSANGMYGRGAARDPLPHLH